MTQGDYPPVSFVISYDNYCLTLPKAPNLSNIAGNMDSQKAVDLPLPTSFFLLKLPEWAQ